MNELLEPFRKTAKYLRHPLVIVGLALCVLFFFYERLVHSGILPPVSENQSASILQTILDNGFALAIVVVVLGFGLQLFRIYRDTNINKIREQLEKKALETLKKELSSTVSETHIHRDVVRALRDALAALSNQTDLPRSHERISIALELAAKGQTAAAEILFLEVERSSIEQGNDAYKRAAAAARHRGALAFSHDIEKAKLAYKRATQLDPDNVDGWNELGRLALRFGDVREAETAYRRVIFECKKRNDPICIAIGYSNLGNVLRTQGDNTQAEKMYLHALGFFAAENDKEGIALCHRGLAIVCENRGDLHKAEMHYHNALSISEALGHKKEMAMYYDDLGVLYKALGDLEKAKRMHYKSLEAHKTLEHKLGMAQNYINLGGIYLTQRNFKDAEMMLNRAIEICKPLGWRPGLARSLRYLGDLFREQRRPADAKVRYLEAEEIYQQVDSSEAAKVRNLLEQLGTTDLQV